MSYNYQGEGYPTAPPQQQGGFAQGGGFAPGGFAPNNGYPPQGQTGYPEMNPTYGPGYGTNNYGRGELDRQGYGPGSPHHHYGNHHHHHRGRRGRWGGFRHRVGRWRTNYSSGGGHVSCAGCIFILFVISAIGFGIGGAVMLAGSSEDTRTDRIDAYNQYLYAWKNFVSTESEFQAPPVLMETQVICNNNPGGKQNYSLPLSRVLSDTFSDRKAMKDGAKPLDPQYKFTASLTFNNINPSTCNIQTKIIANGKLTGTFNSPFAPVKTYTCRWRSKTDQDRAFRDCKKRCVNSFGGTFYGETCTYYQQLQEICLKVKEGHHTDGIDSLDPDVDYPPVPNPGGSFGCFYSKTEQKFLVGKWTNGAGSPGNYGLKVSVRYNKDAYLGYMRVTQGSGDFGLSSETKVCSPLSLSLSLSFSNAILFANKSSSLSQP